MAVVVRTFPMQMLSSNLPCPRCGAHATITVLGATGADSALGEITFQCPNGDSIPADVSRADVLAVWTRSRTPSAR